MEQGCVRREGAGRSAGGWPAGDLGDGRTRSDVVSGRRSHSDLVPECAHVVTGQAIGGQSRRRDRKFGASEVAPEALRQAVAGCQRVTNAIEAGAWRQGDSGWA